MDPKNIPLAAEVIVDEVMMSIVSNAPMEVNISFIMMGKSNLNKLRDAVIKDITAFLTKKAISQVNVKSILSEINNGSNDQT